MSAGIRNPKRSVLIALGLTLLAVCAVGWGLFEMDRRGAETPATAAAVGVGLLVAVLGFFLTINFVWAVRLVGAMRRGEGVIARWTVPPAQFDDFRTNEAAHKTAGRANDYKAPRKTPPGGVEIVFTASAVLIGDTFFGLARDGIARFTAARVVSGNPPCLAFSTAMTVGRTGASGARFETVAGELRVPIARTSQAEARAVLDHFRAVAERRKIVNPNFWPRRIRIGLGAALVAGVICAGGFALNALRVDLGIAPLVMAVAGAVTALGGLVLALIAWRIHVQR
jgi:hypothetical protein